MKAVAKLTLATALLLSGAAFAQTTTSSSPAEKVQTQRINQGVTDANAAATANGDKDNAQYQEELQKYRMSQANYEERSARYEAARDRYVAAHTRYRRAGWPSRYEHSLIVDTRDLLGAHVETYDGRTVGHVAEIALSSGSVDALRVTLNNGRGDVWIERADLRFDSESTVVMTNLDRADLYAMSRDNF